MKLKDFSSIFVTGAKNFATDSNRYMIKELKSVCKIYEEAFCKKFEGYIMTGALRVVEEKVNRAARDMCYRTLTIPANFQMYSGTSAEQMRNADVIDTFKPELIVIFATEKQIEDDTVLDYLKRIAIKKNIRFVRIGK